MGKNSTEGIREWASLLLLTAGVVIIVLGAIRAFGIPVFEIIFQSPILEENANGVIGLGTAFTFIAIWLQQKPFTRILRGLRFR